MEKKGMLHLAFEKIEIYFWEIGFVDCKWTNLNTPWSYNLCCYLLLEYNGECPVCHMLRRALYEQR